MEKFTSTAGPIQTKRVAKAISHFLWESKGRIEITNFGRSHVTGMLDEPLPASVEKYNEIFAAFGGCITAKNCKEIEAAFTQATAEIVLPEIDLRETPEQIATREAARRAEDERRAAEAAERDAKTADIVAELRARYPWAVSQDGYKTGAARCAANIKRELTGLFPGVKFSVKSDTFSMGDSVDVSWEMGPSTDTVNAILSKYQDGRFNSTEDYYENDNSAHGRAVDIVLGRAKYVHSKNDRWELKRKLAPTVCERYGVTFTGSLDVALSTTGHWDELRRRLSDIVDGVDFPAGVTVDDVTLDDDLKIVYPEPTRPTATMPEIVGSYDVQKHYHDKRGIDFWLAVPTSRLSEADYQAALDRCKASGGWYSRKWGKTPGGFAFTTPEAANAFAGTCEAIASEPTREPVGSNPAERLRELADGMESEIDHKTRPLSQNWTPKRGREHASRLYDGEQLRRAQKALQVLADHHDAGTVPPILRGLRTKSAILPLVRNGIARNHSTDCIYDSGEPSSNSPEAVALRALIESPIDAEAEAERKAARELQNDIDALRGVKIEGFFPTPELVADRVAEAAQIEPGQTVLEPGAGIGSLCEAARRACPDCTIEAIEIRPSLASIVKRKGYSVEEADFLELTREDNDLPAYDRILMNPPFERGQDIKHVEHAYKFLKPGGRLVAIVSAGPFFRSDSASQEFRAWLDRVGAVVEDLDDAFDSPDAFRSTGVRCKLVTIDAPASPSAPKSEPVRAEKLCEDCNAKPGQLYMAYPARLCDECADAREHATPSAPNDCESVCVVDFAGNNRQPGMWADYYPARKVTCFGGYWCEVPDMPSDSEPTEEAVEAWAAKYKDVCEAGYQAYLATASNLEEGHATPSAPVESHDFTEFEFI